MAGKHFPTGGLRSTSFPFSSSLAVTSLSLLALFLTFFFFFHNNSSSSRCLLISDPLDSPLHLSKRNPNPSSDAGPPPEYSFVASLEKFLTTRAPPFSSSSPADAAASQSAVPDDGDAPTAAAAKALDDSMWKEETERLYGDPLDPWSAPSVVRVYVYDMPSKFTYDLLWLFRNTYKETVNLTSNGSPVHRLIEQVL